MVCSPLKNEAHFSHKTALMLKDGDGEPVVWPSADWVLPDPESFKEWSPESLNHSSLAFINKLCT